MISPFKSIHSIILCTIVSLFSSAAVCAGNPLPGATFETVPPPTSSPALGQREARSPKIVSGARPALQGGLVGRNRVKMGDWGQEKTVTRDTPNFSTIRLVTFGHVVWKRSSKPYIKISGPEFVLPKITTAVESGNLSIRVQPGEPFNKSVLIEVGSLVMDGADVAGPGFLELQGVSSTNFRAKLSGTGALSADGEAQTIVAILSGSGKMDLGNLKAKKIEALASGTGFLRVNPTLEIIGTVSPMAYIALKQKPRLIDISGPVERIKTE